MDQATITSRTLEIDGMSGEACVQKVKGALKGVHGVSTQSVEVGSATIGADQSGCDAACKAIGKAGYEAREDMAHNDEGGASNAHGSYGAKGNAGQNASGAGNSQSAAMGNKSAGSNGDKPMMNSSDKNSGNSMSTDKMQGDKGLGNSNADRKSTPVTPTPGAAKK